MPSAPDLDYAFLAEFASIAEGKLMVVGGSFTHVTVPNLNRGHLLAVAGRVRAEQDTPPIKLGIEFEAPAGGGFKISSESDILPGPASRPYNGKVGILFTLSTVIPLPIEGLYTVNLSLNGDHVRRLAFDVEVVEP